MNIFFSSPSFTTDATVFHRQLSHIVAFPPSTPIFRSFTSISITFCDFKFANLRCKSFNMPNNKDKLLHSDLPFVDENHAIKKYVKSIKSIFDTLDDGVITPSAYDTAWVALIEDINGKSDGPRFPSSLLWVENNQLPDGSWGEPLVFSAFDRLHNTLACVIALTYWNIDSDKCERGMKFIEENINKLGDEKEEHMTQGFEVLFPSLIELAQKLEIKVPNGSPALREIYARREMKLSKIPKDIFHKTPTILLYILEGMKDLEWEKLLKIRSENGSFFFSPSATAFAFMQTKDQKCLAYLTNLVAKFKGGVPHLYPVEMFEKMWIVDRLQRLGIARYFRSEIKDCVDYIYRYWNEQGYGFTRNCNLPDIDETAMGFRLLRTNGYQVSSDVFRHFEKDGQFVCYHGQSAEAVTVMFNLYRTSQVLFPGEKILDDAKKFSYNFLTIKRSTNELLDKWIITKDLAGEVGFALDVPWYASLPRLEARYYLEQYGGEDDVWIGKSLYRWYAVINIEESLNTRLLWSYYEAAVNIFEPERCNERLAWAKTNVILNTIKSFFSRLEFSNDDIQAFVNEFTNTEHYVENGNPLEVVMNALHETLNQISSDTLAAHDVDINPHLLRVWKVWLLNLQNGVNAVEGEAELIVQTINLSSGRWLPEDPLSHPQYQRLSLVTNDLCYQITHKGNQTIGSEIESKMQEIVQLVLCHSCDDVDPDLKQIFLTVAKTF